ncbi:hypothetical protein KR026_009899 [Drosophila bipectinata]|nr:hypothetical protein KR026_009899 [Drosophila bipectinata]
MKISIRTLDQRTIKLEMSDSQDVRALKQRLGSMPEVAIPVDSQQLIYGGRIMEDALPLSDYKIAEDKFIVLMGKKMPPAKPQGTSAEEQVPPTPPLTAGPSETQTHEVPPLSPAPALALMTPASALEPAPPSIAPNEQRVRDLMAMGYGEQEVRAALRASFNHPERAIEYLINGIPQNAPQPANTATSGPPQTLQPLISDPRFARVREMIRRNPELLEVVLSRLAEDDPSAFEAIRNHQEEFLNMINGSGSGVVGEGSELSEESEGDLSLAHTITLTSEEAAAVERLVSLGFHRDLAVQAYLACDKNEELAADILFRQSEEDQ